MAKPLPTIKDVAKQFNISPAKLKKMIDDEVERQLKLARNEMANTLNEILDSLPNPKGTHAKSKSRKSRKA